MSKSLIFRKACLFFTIEVLFVSVLSQISVADSFFKSAYPLDLKTESKPYLCIPFIQQGPSLDGNLHDSAWQSAAIITNWSRCENAKPGSIPASTRLMADSSNLYVGFSAVITCPSNANLRIPEKNGDEYGGSLLELFFSGVGAQKVQICANPVGLRYDALNDNAKWNGSWSAKGQVSATNWTLEIAIPAADLGLKEFKDATWLRGNVCFVDCQERLFSWTGQWGQPETFGDFFIGKGNDYAARIRSGLTCSCVIDRDVYDPRDVAGIAVFQVLSRGRDIPKNEFTARFQLSSENGQAMAETNVILISRSLGLTLDLRPLVEGNYKLNCNLTLADNTNSIASASVSFQKARRPLIPEGRPQGRIPIRTWAEPPAKSNNWPISIGIPFAQGVLTSADNVRLLADDGKDIPCQTVVRSRWSPGGSIEWLGLDFVAPLGSTSRTFTVDYGPDVQRKTFPALTCSETPEQISITSDFLKLIVSRKSFNLIDSLYFDSNGDKNFSPNELILHGGPNTGPYLIDNEGNRYEAALDRNAEVIVEEKGPVKTTILATGWYVKRGSAGTKISSMLPTDKLCQFRIRISVSASTPLVRFSVSTIMTHDTAKVRLKDLAIALPVISPEVIRIGLEGNTNIVWDGEQLKSNPYLLQCRWDRSVADAQRVYPRATGWAEVRTPVALMVCAMRNFWKLFPKEIEFSNSALIWHAWPAHGQDNVFELKDQLTTENIYKLWYVHQGRELNFRFPDSYSQFLDKLYEEYKRLNNWVYKYPYYEKAKTANAQGLCVHNDYVFGFYPPQTPAGRQGPILSFLADEDPQAVADPAYVCGTGVFGPILHADYGGSFAANEKLMDENFQGLASRTEQNKEYGQFIFGGWHEGYEGVPLRPAIHRVWPNGHFAVVRLALMQYIRTGNPMYLRWARNCGNNLRDIAMIHYVSDDLALARHKGAMYHCYGFVPWGADSWVVGHPSTTDWLALEYYLTGNRRSYDVMLEWVEALKKLQPPGNIGREGIQPLGDMVVAYRLTWDPVLVPIMRNFENTIFSKPLAGQPWWDYQPLTLMRYHGLTGNQRVIDRYRAAATETKLNRADYGGWNRHLDAYFALLDNNPSAVQPWPSRLYTEARRETTGHWIYYAYRTHKQPYLLKALDHFGLKPEPAVTTIPAIMPVLQKTSLVALRETTDRAIPVNISFESWKSPLTVRIWNSGGTCLQDKRFEPPKDAQKDKNKISLEIPADKSVDDYLIAIHFGNDTDCALWPVSDLPLEVSVVSGGEEGIQLLGGSESAFWASGNRYYFKCGELAGKEITIAFKSELMDSKNNVVWTTDDKSPNKTLPNDAEKIFSLYAIAPGVIRYRFGLPKEGRLFLGLTPESLFVPRLIHEPRI